MIVTMDFLKPFSKFLREDLKRHFIRGYFDGDGSVSINMDH